jgi:hypothetical protein
MSEVKRKNIKMLKADRGAPEGHTVVDFPEGFTGKVNADLADAFIASGSAEELPSDEGVVIVPSWPPTDEQILALTFSGLGVLLEQKGVALGPLKSEEARRDALRDVIDDEFVPPWPAYEGTDRIKDVVLARKLKAAGVDITLLKSRDDAEAKLRETMGIITWPPTDEQIASMGDKQLADLLHEKGADLSEVKNGDEARAKIRELIAAEAQQ